MKELISTVFSSDDGRGRVACYEVFTTIEQTGALLECKTGVLDVQTENVLELKETKSRDAAIRQHLQMIKAIHG